MKRSILAISVLCAAFAAQAGTTVSDDFNRADQPPTNDTSVIGGTWAQEAGSTDQWVLNNNMLHSRAQVGEGFLYNHALETVSGNGTNFTASVDIALKVDNSWSGMVFNYQDEDHLYMFRMKTGFPAYQVLSKNGASYQVILNKNASQNWEKETFYTMTVSSDDPYNFGFKITKKGEFAVLGSGTGVDAGNLYTGGHAGVYAASTGLTTKYDNFSLYVGEPIIPPGIDDFNRPDVAVTSDTSLLGRTWTNGAGAANEWTIVSGIMHSHPLTRPGILYSTELETIGGNGTKFTLNVDVASKNPGLWSGVVFNYQNENNYYYIRFQEGSSRYQMVAMAGGTESIIVDETDASTTFAEDLFYTINVASDGNYKFNFTITEVGSSTVLNPTTVAVDSSESLADGYAGLLAPHVGYSSKFDNFALRLIVGGYEGWTTGWGTDIGAKTDDFDHDGLVNIYEYGLGGDPTNALDQGTSPEFGVENVGGTNWFGYIHPQLSDLESGLSYHLELNTDLVTGAWTNSGYTVTGTNVTGGELNFVTNVTDTVEGEKFIRLIIK